MRAAFFSICMAAAFVLQAKETGAPAPGSPQMVVDLLDGSRIIGAPSLDRLKITTQYAGMDVPLSRMRFLEFKGTDRVMQVTLQNGDTVKGRLSATEIALSTVFGPLTIPLRDVARIRVSAGGKSMPEGLVLHYTFDDIEGDRVIDASQSGNDGTVHGATQENDGKIDGAMRFGNAQAVIVRNAPSLQLQDFTIMLWLKRGDRDKTSNTTNGAVLFDYGNGGYGLGIRNDGSPFLAQISMNSVYSSFKIADGNFHHLAVTKKGDKVVFYLDGVAYPAGAYNHTFVFNTNLAVGAEPDSLEASFLGLIDEVAVFNRPLEEDEVKDVYDSQK